MNEETEERLRGLYEDRLDRLTERLDSDGAAREHVDRHATSRREMIGAERRRLAELAAEHAYTAGVLREVGHELDLEESRLH